MDGFNYNNIFETKGIEYLVTVVFFAVLIPFWIVLNRQGKNIKRIQQSLGALTPNSLKIPQGLFFTRFHTWTHLERSGLAKVGLDDLLVRITGEVKLNRILEPGEKIEKGDFLAEIVQNEKLLKIYSPISGEIIEANYLLTNNSEIITEDPYTKGWIYKMKPNNWISETQSYLLAEDATTYSKHELNRFKDFLARTMKTYSPDSAMIIMQDGGEIMDHSLSSMNDLVWKDFQDEFLNPERLEIPAN